MAETIIGIDLGKLKFHVCVLNANGHRFLANTQPAVVAMEACPGSHYLARKAASFGHTPLVLPAQYVKPYVKSQKNDTVDAEAIAEAASRPTVRERAVAIKPEERQTLQLLHRQRSGWIGERTALGNRMRAMLLEFGTALLAGIGDASQFRRGRDLAAWLGLVPRQHSTGGKTRLLGISKHGSRHLRMMLIHGARAVLRVANKRPAEDGLRRWVERITARKHANVAVVALANKLARIVCAVLQRREPFAPAQVTG